MGCSCDERETDPLAFAQRLKRLRMTRLQQYTGEKKNNDREIFKDLESLCLSEMGVFSPSRLYLFQSVSRFLQSFLLLPGSFRLVSETPHLSEKRVRLLIQRASLAA
jgi:hypothetical protein